MDRAFRRALRSWPPKPASRPRTTEIVEPAGGPQCKVSLFASRREFAPSVRRYAKASPWVAVRHPPQSLWPHKPLSSTSDASHSLLMLSLIRYQMFTPRAAAIDALTNASAGNVANPVRSSMLRAITDTGCGTPTPGEYEMLRSYPAHAAAMGTGARPSQL